ncbi:MAG: peptidoglycan-binding protein [Bacillota bacterium]
MAESQGENPWRRILRPGMRGRDVTLLQERLACLGYYAGEIDGVFGILTKDAVRDLQKAHRLRVDGIAGSEVFAVLRSGLARPVVRHFVARGETIAHVARKHNIPIELLLQANRLPDPEVQEGQCLNIPVARLLAYLPEGDGGERSWNCYERHLASISAVAPRWFTLNADGTVAGEPVKRVTALASLADIRVLPVVSIDPYPLPPMAARRGTAMGGRGTESDRESHGDGQCDGAGEPTGERDSRHEGGGRPESASSGRCDTDTAPAIGHCSEGAQWSPLDEVLMDAPARRAAVKGIAAAAARSRAHGVVLSVCAPGPRDAYAFTSFARELAFVLERDGRDLSLDIPAPADRPEGDAVGAGPLEYHEIARIARQIIVRLQARPERLAVPAPPASPARARAVLKAVVRLMPPWKMVLGVPLFGVDFSAAPGAPPMRRAYSETADILDIYKPSVVRTEPGGACAFRYRSFRVNHTVFFEDATSVASYVDLVLKFNLAGLAIADLGDEDPRVWDAFRTRFKALRDSLLPA